MIPRDVAELLDRLLEHIEYISPRYTAHIDAKNDLDTLRQLLTRAFGERVLEATDMECMTHPGVRVLDVCGVMKCEYGCKNELRVRER